MRRTTGVLVAMIAAAATTAGCGDGGSDAAPSTFPTPVTAPATDQAPDQAPGGGGTPRPTVTQTVTVPAPGGTGAGAGGQEPATAGQGKCLDLGSPVVQRAVATLPDFRGTGYRAVRGSGERLGACPDMLWAEAHLEGGTGSSPMWVMFFDRSGYLGTDIARPTALTHVTGGTTDSVAVQYRWLNPGDPTAGPTGGPVTVTYTLRDGTVTPDRDVLPQAYGEK